jgi:hypothetical protein
MARIRSIKPEFWTSEQVMDLSPNARLLFIGLWNFCDDAGIHPASLKRLKAEVMPADDVRSEDVRRMIDECINVGLVREYEIDGERYWAVTGWHHQKIDQPSYKYPNEDGTVPEGPAKRRQAGKKPDKTPQQEKVFAERSPPEGKGREGSGVEGKGGERKDQEHLSPADAGSGVNGADLLGEPLDDKRTRPAIPVRQIVDLYHAKLPMLRAVEKITDARRGSIQQRWREDLPTLEAWGRYFDDVAASPFLTGRVPGRDGKPPFRADLEWLCKPGSFAKVAEGKYHE